MAVLSVVWLAVDGLVSYSSDSCNQTDCSHTDKIRGKSWKLPTTTTTAATTSDVPVACSWNGKFAVFFYFYINMIVLNTQLRNDNIQNRGKIKYLLLAIINDVSIWRNSSKCSEVPECICVGGCGCGGQKSVVVQTCQILNHRLQNINQINLTQQ